MHPGKKEPAWHSPPTVLSPHSCHPELLALLSHPEVAMWGLHQELDLPLWLGCKSASPRFVLMREWGRAGEATVVPSQSSCWTRSLELAEWGMQGAPGLQPSLHIRSPVPRSCPQPGSLFQTSLPCQLLSGAVHPLLPWPLAPSLPWERGGGVGVLVGGWPPEARAVVGVSSSCVLA